ncbi:MAG: 23S rRNA (pseudouridine(1915)-N(3))-methyltransferase RlmH [Clostridia bacterium]|nr:23S rRNA (pseudouridine(1915)-N(3))-methyltransferase RlmH [Clostridia bacterium]
MKFKVVAVGKIKEAFFRDAIAEYVKRISRFGKAEVVEVDECLFQGNPNPKEKDKILQTEGKAILSKLEGFVVALDIDGQTLTSNQLSQAVCNAKQTHSCITFVIGGSYGLLDQVKQQANLRLSFGRITLPHQLARVVLFEQIYRACTIENNVSYHK